MEDKVYNTKIERLACGVDCGCTTPIECKFIPVSPVEKETNRENNEYTPQRVLDLLWEVRLEDRFYFDTYGKLAISFLIEEIKATTKPK